jgi:hypothetical protein
MSCHDSDPYRRKTLWNVRVVRSACNASGADGSEVRFYVSVYYFQEQPWPNLIPYPAFPGSSPVTTHSEGVYPVRR